MAFAVVVNSAESATATASTSHIVNLPSSLVTGNQIIILSTKGSAGTTPGFNTLSGWTEIVDEAIVLGITVWVHDIIGGEGATVTFTSSSATRSAQIAYQISGAATVATQAPQLSTVATGASTAPNATTCTPTGGAKDYLWISFFNLAGEEADDDTWVTAAPAGYTGLLQKACGVAGTNLGGLIASAHRTNNAASEDAGAFTTVASVLNNWRAYTLAVHPATAVAEAVNPVDLIGITDTGTQRYTARNRTDVVGIVDSATVEEGTGPAFGYDTFHPEAETYGGTSNVDDAQTLNLGQGFYWPIAGATGTGIRIHGVRYWRTTRSQASAPSVHICKITGTGATTTAQRSKTSPSSGSVAAGWETLLFDTPYDITDHETYQVWMHLPSQGYPVTASYFTNPDLSQDGLMGQDSSASACFTYGVAATTRAATNTGAGLSTFWVDPLATSIGGAIDHTRTPVDTIGIVDSVEGVEPPAGYAHGWQGANPVSGGADATTYNLGTQFSLLTGPQTLRGIRIWNPGIVNLASVHGENRQAYLWTHTLPTGGTVVTQRTIDIPDLLPAGWSEHLFSTPYVATTGVQYCVGYRVHGSGSNADYGVVAGAIDPLVDYAPFRFDEGCFVAGPSPNDAFPTSIGSTFYGVDVLYEGADTPESLTRTPVDTIGITEALTGLPTNPIPAENALTGYAPSNWQIVPTSDTASTSNLNAVGFTTAMSVAAGSSIDFKIHTGGVGYSLEILRLGYYQGNGARLITTMSGRPGVTQSEGVQGGVGTGEASVGSRDCAAWTVTDTWSVPSDAVHGVYLGVIKRTGHSGVYSHVGPFVVHTAYSANAKILCKLSDMTWRAYNTFGTLASPAGGKSLYGIGSGIFSQADRAWSVTYDAPLMTATGALQTSYWNGEQPIHTWLERNGYDVAYAAGLDIEADASLLLGRSVIMSCGHDEYWTQNVRDAWDTAINSGVHAVVMSGNTMLWRTRMSGRTMWCYKNSHALSGTGTGIDPVSWTGTFRDTRWDQRRPENESIGTMFLTNGIRSDEMEVIYAYKTAPIWRNIATIAALTVGTAETLRNDILGFEWDSYEGGQYPNSMNYPPGFLTLSFKSFSISGGVSDENGAIYTLTDSSVEHFIIAFKRGTSVTVNFGMNQWGWGLSDLHFRGGSGTNLTMKQATVNLFADLGCQPATLESLAGLAAATNTLGSWAFPTLSSMTTPTTAGVIEGLTTQLNAAAVWSNGLTSTLNPYATWETSNAAIATVSSRGVVTGVAPGVCTITATYGAASDTTTFTVTASLGAEHVWTGTTPSGQNDGTALELGTYFTVSATTELIGVRLWNPGQMAPEGGGNRTATLWTHNGTGGSATVVRSIDVPDLLPAGWSEHAFSTPYNATTGVNYCVSYWANGTATVQDYGAVSGGLTSAVTAGPVTFPIDGGRYINSSPSGSSCPTTEFGHSYYGVDVLYSGGGAPEAESRTPADTVGITDSVTVVEADAVQHTDNVGITDSTTRDVTRQLVRTPTDLIGITDTVERVEADRYERTDLVGIVDSVQIVSPAVRAFTDTVGIVDNTTRDKLSLDSVDRTDLVGIVDSTVRLRVGPRTVTRTDLIGIVDSNVRLHPALRTRTDLVGITDTVFVSTGITEGLITCAVDGPLLGRDLDGPARKTITVYGPVVEEARLVSGPAVETILNGPVTVSKVVAGPARATRGVTGPDLSRDVTGPDTEQLTVTGPGACDAD